MTRKMISERRIRESCHRYAGMGKGKARAWAKAQRQRGSGGRCSYMQAACFIAHVFPLPGTPTTIVPRAISEVSRNSGTFWPSMSVATCQLYK
jgi:hypothetical protein